MDKYVSEIKSRAQRQVLDLHNDRTERWVLDVDDKANYDLFTELQNLDGRDFNYIDRELGGLCFAYPTKNKILILDDEGNIVPQVYSDVCLRERIRRANVYDWLIRSSRN